MVHVPIRQCRVCRTRRPQSQLVRWAIGPSGPEPETGTRTGRGFYTCPDCSIKLKPKRSTP